MLCPCGRPAALEACCGRFIQGWEDPTTAEELMRSRFTAYALGEVDYLVATHDPAHLPDRAQIAAWARRARFTALDVDEVVDGGPDDDTGIVEFSADFVEEGRKQEHRERSRFKRIDGRWYYVDGTTPKKKR
jgi:SEC-C motif-containing protein